MKKVVTVLLSLILLLPLTLVGCNQKTEIATDVSFEINANTATYIDPYYQVTVNIPHYDYFSYNFGFADPEDWREVSPTGEGSPCRSLSIFYQDDEDLRTDYTIPHSGFISNFISINGWVSHTGYYRDFDGEETEIKTDNGKRGFYKKNQSDGRIRIIFSIENEFCQIEVDVSEKAYSELEEIVMSMFRSLSTYPHE